jgi:hypothetical protein
MGITLPTSTASNVLSFVATTLSDPGMFGFVVLILGVLLAVVVIEILINAIRPK